MKKEQLSSALLSLALAISIAVCATPQTANALSVSTAVDKVKDYIKTKHDTTRDRVSSVKTVANKVLTQVTGFPAKLLNLPATLRNEVLEKLNDPEIILNISRGFITTTTALTDPVLEAADVLVEEMTPAVDQFLLDFDDAVFNGDSKLISIVARPVISLANVAGIDLTEDAAFFADCNDPVPLPVPVCAYKHMHNIDIDPSRHYIGKELCKLSTTLSGMVKDYLPEDAISGGVLMKDTYKVALHDPLTLICTVGDFSRGIIEGEAKADKADLVTGAD